jgi:hypothetical protein
MVSPCGARHQVELETQLTNCNSGSIVDVGLITAERTLSETGNHMFPKE